MMHLMDAKVLCIACVVGIHPTPVGQSLNSLRAYTQLHVCLHACKLAKTCCHPELVLAAGMMSEIMQRGPITCSIACPDDFIWNYTGGVYTDVNNSTDVDHDVEVVGWGHEDGKDFWHIRNSWGMLYINVPAPTACLAVVHVCRCWLCKLSYWNSALHQHTVDIACQDGGDNLYRGL